MNVKGAYMTMFAYLEKANKMMGVTMLIAFVVTVIEIEIEKVILTGMYLTNDMPHAIQM